MKLNKKAFTLIELLVVVLIIGILSAIALPQYQTAVDKAHYSTMMAAVRALKNEQELYYLANGKYATDITELSGAFPAECNSDGSNCGKFKLQLGSNYVFGALLSSKVGIRNAFILWHEHLSSIAGGMECYAYNDDGERGRKLCKSMGGVLRGTEGGGCGTGGTCSYYTLKF